MCTMMRRLSPIALVVATVLMLAGSSAAVLDDKNQIATSKPERSLSGIEVGIRPKGTHLPNGTSISKIMRMYGPAASREDAVVPDGAGGTRFYKWEWPGLRMSVATYFFYRGTPEKKTMKESHPAYVDMWGDAPRGAIGTTGRGFALGCTLEQQKAIYGDHYSAQYPEQDGSTPILMEWEDGTTMTVYYGKNGRSNHIRLTSRER